MAINLKPSALLSAALLGSAALTFGAHAQNTPREVVVTISPLSGNITYSKPPGNKTPALTSLIGALVTIENKSGNTLNNVFFRPTWEVTGGLTAEFTESAGSPCSGTGTNIVCTVGQLQAQLPTSSFVIFFKSPVSSDTLERVFYLGGTAYYAEGTTDTQNNPNSSYVVPNDNRGKVTLGTANPVLVKSGVKKTGTGIPGFDDIFTGDGGVPVSATTVPNAALLYVPGLPSSNYGFAALAINKPNVGSNNTVDQCPTSAPGCLALFSITVTDKDPLTNQVVTTFEFTNPGGAKKEDYLLITLRRAADLFKGNINNAPVYYFYDYVNTWGLLGWQSIGPCSNDTDPLKGVEADRCVLERKVLQNSDPEVKENPALKGVAQIKVLAKKNGWVAW